jgi:1,4-alpha-glucan branching enzyme
VDTNDADGSTYSFLRKSRASGEVVLCVFNCTPVVREHYRVGVPGGGYWRELFNSDAGEYWGSGVGNGGGAQASAANVHGRPHALELTLPPLGALLLKPDTWRSP